MRKTICCIDLRAELGSFRKTGCDEARAINAPPIVPNAPVDREGVGLTPMSTSGNAFVNFIDVQKSYDGETLVVKDLNLAIRRGEFLTLLGPSGSGKTTTLMMLAGFEVPTHGRIVLDGQADQQPAAAQAQHRHGVPELRPVPAHDGGGEPRLPAGRAQAAEGGDRRPRSSARSTWCSCRQMRKRRPAQLSGGQQQRVALARALVFDPKLVLMDEPLGALDKQLREHMQLEIKHIHQSLGVTVVYVTHDQSEALTMSDRVAVFNDGAIQQLATPGRPLRAAAEFLRRAVHRREQPPQRRGHRDERQPAAGSKIGERGRDPRPAGQRRQRRRQDHAVAAAGAGAHQSRQRRLLPTSSTRRVEELIYLGDHTRARVQVLRPQQFRHQGAEFRRRARPGAGRDHPHRLAHGGLPRARRVLTYRSSPADDRRSGSTGSVRG